MSTLAWPRWNCSAEITHCIPNQLVPLTPVVSRGAMVVEERLKESYWSDCLSLPLTLFRLSQAWIQTCPQKRALESAGRFLSVCNASSGDEVSIPGRVQTDTEWSPSMVEVEPDGILSLLCGTDPMTILSEWEYGLINLKTLAPCWKCISMEMSTTA